MTTTELDVSGRLDKLTKDIESFLGHAESHVNSHAVASFETEDAPSMIKSAAKNGTRRYKGAPWRQSLPKSYEAGKLGGQFGDFIRDGFKGGPNWEQAAQLHTTTMMKSLGANSADWSDGGLLVLPEYSPEIMSMLYESNSLWNRTKQFTVKGNSMKFPYLKDRDRTDGARHGGARGYWMGEEDLIQAAKLEYKSTDISLIKLGVAVYLTEEIIEDSAYAVQQFTTEAVQAEIDYMLDRALFTGNGVQKPLGFLNSPARVTVPKLLAQGAGSLVADNILDMWARRAPEKAGQDYVWLCNQDIEPQLHKIYLSTGSSGQLTYTPPGGFSGAPYATLMGKPVIPSEHCKTLGTEGDLVLVDLSEYLSVNKGAISQTSSPHVQFLRDINVIKFTFRINGRPFYDEPLTMENSANKRSAFITLESRP